MLWNKGVLRNCGKTKDGYHYYQVMRKVEYCGEKFKPGDYISRDTLHHEIECFRCKDNHRGAIDVLTGKIKPGSVDKSRRLKIK